MIVRMLADDVKHATHIEMEHWHFSGASEQYERQQAQVAQGQQSPPSRLPHQQPSFNTEGLQGNRKRVI